MAWHGVVRCGVVWSRGMVVPRAVRRAVLGTLTRDTPAFLVSPLWFENVWLIRRKLDDDGPLASERLGTESGAALFSVLFLPCASPSTAP